MLETYTRTENFLLKNKLLIKRLEPYNVQTHWRRVAMSSAVLCYMSLFNLEDDVNYILRYTWLEMKHPKKWRFFY